MAQRAGREDLVPVCDGQCMGKGCGVKVKIRHLLPWLFCAPGILLQTPGDSNANKPLPHRAADLQESPQTNNWVCASILSHSAAAEHGEIYVQEPVPAEKFKSKGRRKKKIIPFFLRHLLIIHYDKVRYSPGCWHGAPVLSFWPPSEEVSGAGELLH